MSSETYNPAATSSPPSSSKTKRQSRLIPLDSGQECIASAMARIVQHMVNKELQQRCKELLEMEDMAETEARILFILQQIDKEREREEAEKKQENKKRRTKRKLVKEK